MSAAPFANVGGGRNTGTFTAFFSNGGLDCPELWPGHVTPRQQERFVAEFIPMPPETLISDQYPIQVHAVELAVGVLIEAADPDIADPLASQGPVAFPVSKCQVEL